MCGLSVSSSTNVSMGRRYSRLVVGYHDQLIFIPSSCLQPFGHNLSQASILEQNTILNATDVEFPPRPLISQETKVRATPPDCTYTH